MGLTKIQVLFLRSKGKWILGRPISSAIGMLKQRGCEIFLKDYSKNTLSSSKGGRGLLLKTTLNAKWEYRWPRVKC